MKLNRKWILVIALMLSMATAISGTLAYLTDRDAVENTFSMGNVDIELKESYAKDTMLMPGIEVTKKAYIKNVHATEDAYVWMVVSVPAGMADYIDLIWADGYTATKVPENSAAHAGYTSYLVKYPDVLKANESTGNILTGVKLGERVDYQNGVYVNVGNDGAVLVEIDDTDVGKIIVDAYAIQTDGFEDVNAAYAAYVGQWGKLNSNANAEAVPTPEVPAVPEPIVVYSAEELQQYIDAATEDTILVLADSITGNITVPQHKDVKITIRGQGESFSGVLIVDGRSATAQSAGLVLENLHFKGTKGTMDACINLGDGTSNTRYTCNVTIQNCTFDVANAVAIKSYTGGDWNLTVRNCTVSETVHSLMQVDNIKGTLLIEDCEVNSVRGMSVNHSANVIIDNCIVDVQKYAVRFGDSGGDGTAETYWIKNSTLTSKNVDNDATIVFRGAANDATLTLQNTTVNATTDELKIANTIGATVVTE